MRNLRIRNRRHPKTLYAGVALLAAATVIAVAVYGTLWNGEAVDGGKAGAVELTHETGNGHELAEEAHGHLGGYHEAAGSREREAGEVLEITLDAEEWRFEPSIVEVPVGHRVKLTLVNNGMVDHDVEVVGVPTDGLRLWVPPNGTSVLAEAITLKALSRRMHCQAPQPP